MDPQTRSSINSRIIYKSRQKAIREKDERYANRVAEFARGTYPPNSEAGKKTYEYNMLAYYKQTNDTLNYLVRALYYYDNYYMLLSVDSVKARDSLRMKSLSNAKVGNEEVIRKGDTVLTKRTISFTPIAQQFTQEMNEAARIFIPWLRILCICKKD